MRLIVIIITIALLSGCAHIEPHWELGIGWQDNKNTDYWLQNERSWQCDTNLSFDGELGVKTKTKYPVRLYYDHRSWVACGVFQFDDREEVYDNSIRLSIGN